MRQLVLVSLPWKRTLELWKCSKCIDFITVLTVSTTFVRDHACLHVLELLLISHMLEKPRSATITSVLHTLSLLDQEIECYRSGSSLFYHLSHQVLRPAPSSSCWYYSPSLGVLLKLVLWLDLPDSSSAFWLAVNLLRKNVDSDIIKA